MAADTIRLTIPCPRCVGWLLTIVGPPHPTATLSAWTCPYCSKLQHTDSGGSLVRVIKRDMGQGAKA